MIQDPLQHRWEYLYNSGWWCFAFSVAPVIIVLLCFHVFRLFERDFWYELAFRRKLGRVKIMGLEISAETKVLELGGGAYPMIVPACAGGSRNHLNVDTRLCQTPDGRRAVDFTADFNETLPINSEEFDIVLSRFALEHLSYLRVKPFVAEIHRVLKPGGKAVVIVPNTEAQLRWILAHEDGWDGKDLFLAASEKLFGDQAHGERAGDANPGIDSHKVYLSPAIMIDLFTEAGFVDCLVQPFGERATDQQLQATKPVQPSTPLVEGNREPAERAGEATAVDRAKASAVASAAFSSSAPPLPRLAEFETTQGRASVFSKRYFDGGQFGGGYAGQGYSDFPCHWATLKHVLARQPKSVIELGASRGYLVKRLQDAGVPAWGFDISRHCVLTRVCEGIFQQDACEIPWQIGPAGTNGSVDLCLSTAFWEHVPEELVPAIAAEMARVSKRGLHGIDLSENRSSTDRTKSTLKSRAWWKSVLPPGHEILDKNQLEQGSIDDVIKGDGKVKLNIGSHTTMFHHGWTNIDARDVSQFAQANRYDFRRLDANEGLPWMTGTVSLIMMHHFLEHLTYDQALVLLRECRRVIKPDGFMRIAVPNARVVNEMYLNDSTAYNRNKIKSVQDGLLSEFDEMNDDCERQKTFGGKLWAMLGQGHQAAYDEDTLCGILNDAGWAPKVKSFRQSDCKQILAETQEMVYSLPGGEQFSLFVDARPKLG